MKKSLLIVAWLLLMAGGLMAQSQGNRVRFGATLGPEFYSRPSWGYGGVKSSPRLGYEFGFFAKIFLRKNVEFQPVISTSYGRYRWTTTSFEGDPILGYSIVTHWREQFFRLAPLFRFSSNMAGNGIFVTLGPEVFVSYSPAMKYVDYNVTQPISESYTLPRWHGLNGSLQVSLGYQHRFGARTLLSIEPFGRYTLLDSPQVFRWLFTPIHHVSAGLRCGVQF
jgi:hypothetical protein